MPGYGPVLDERLANALIEGVRPAGPALVIAPVLKLFSRYYGGLWVGGRVRLTKSHLVFTPNGLNAALHDRDTFFAIPLREITGAKLEGGFLTKIMAFETAGGTRRLRCFGAAAFLDRIRGAVALA